MSLINTREYQSQFKSDHRRVIMYTDLLTFTVKNI